jgi:hypothetical protein
VKTWQTHVRDAAIRAIDEGAERFGGSGSRMIHKLAKQWRKMSDEDKQELAEIVIAVGGALGAAAAALRNKDGKKSKTKKIAKKTGKKVLKTVAEKVIDIPVKKARKLKK